MSDSDDDETYTAEEASTFSLGFNVCVCGLTSKPELNGRMGATKALVVSNVVARTVSQRILVAVCCAPALGLVSSWDFQK